MNPWDLGSRDYVDSARPLELPAPSQLLDNFFAQSDASRAARGGNAYQITEFANDLLTQRSDAMAKLTGVDHSYWYQDAAENGPWNDAGVGSGSRRRAKLLGYIRNGSIARGDNGLTATPEAAGYLQGNEDYAARLVMLENAVKADPSIPSDDAILNAIREGKIEAQTRASTLELGRPGVAGGTARMLGTLRGETVNLIENPAALAANVVGTVLAPEVKGPTLLAKVGQIALRESVIGGASELPVGLEAKRLNTNVGIPYTNKDVALNVLAAAFGAGALGGAIPIMKAGARLTVDQARKVAAAARERFAAKPETATPDTVQAVKSLEDFADEAASSPTPEVEGAHSAAIGKAQDDLLSGQPVSVDAIAEPVRAAAPNADAVADIPGKRLLTAADIETFDPRALAVDAKLFQFKAGGDEAGVTGKLKDVTTFDARQAGTVLVYEDKAGKQYIVDGHQRMGLAKRAIEGGQDPQTVFLTGSRLREADGWTPETARAQAAFKNIAEGTGTPIDAAKLFRELTPDEIAQMPKLSENNALVRNGRYLARLSDDAFGAVVNDVVPPEQGALVGELIIEPDHQMAALEALKRSEPANLTQARFVVEQVRNSEFVKSTEQGGLFNEAAFAESLVGERARVLDAVVRMVNQDKRTFATLLKREGAIQQAGNKLSREANLARKDESEQIAAIIRQHAYSPGPVSDALNAAARAVRDGQKPAAVADAVVGALKQAADRAVPAGRGAGAGQRGAQEPGLDLLGQDVAARNALLREETARDAARSQGQVDLETGDPSDLFSVARKQADFFAPAEAKMVNDQAAEILAASPDRKIVTAEDGAVQVESAGEAAAKLDNEARALDDIERCAFPMGL